MNKVNKLDRMIQINSGAFNFILTSDISRRNVCLAHILKIDAPVALTTNNSRFATTVWLQTEKHASILWFLIYVYDM